MLINNIHALRVTWTSNIFDNYQGMTASLTYCESLCSFLTQDFTIYYTLTCSSPGTVISYTVAGNYTLILSKAFLIHEF